MCGRSGQGSPLQHNPKYPTPARPAKRCRLGASVSRVPGASGGKPPGPGSPPSGLVVGHEDRRGHPYPAQQRPAPKIDAAVALMMAVGCAMAEDTDEGDLEDLLRNPVIA